MKLPEGIPAKVQLPQPLRPQESDIASLLSEGAIKKHLDLFLEEGLRLKDSVLWPGLRRGGSKTDRMNRMDTTTLRDGTEVKMSKLFELLFSAIQNLHAAMSVNTALSNDAYVSTAVLFEQVEARLTDLLRAYNVYFGDPSEENKNLLAWKTSVRAYVQSVLECIEAGAHTKKLNS